ncbi:MAG: acyl CoA:acetate/3-ketoacid CoA transferase [Myxococcaceae bacterium]|nr:MAG: acyl CoA:acetate/3-ketoacid CoA transferase [Myxococcaceae bacterium]
MSPSSVSKVVSLDEAVALIQPGSTLATSGFVGIGTPDGLLESLARAYQTQGRPGGLTLVFAAGQGDGKTRGLNRLAVPGLLKRVVGGHWGLIPRVGALALAGEIEAYNLPQGCISHLYRDIAGGKPGTLSRVGLGTFVDPRNGGGKVNSRTTEDIVELLPIHGEDWLLYRAFPIDVVFLRGTTADPHGNVSMEREALTLDNLAMAMAAKNSGGLVIVQVERLADAGSLPARSVKIPGALVDCVAVAPAEYHAQTYATDYSPAFSGELRVPLESMPPPHLDGRKVIGRRAACELIPGTLINLGIGMPESVAGVAAEEGLLSLVTLTAEPGVIGGLPASGLNFGAAVNTEALVDQNQQFDFYDGGGLDQAYLGMAQVDAAGNVNVSRFGKTFAGCGGFINISQNSRKVVFVGTFTCGGLKLEIGEGRLRIVKEGQSRKFVPAVEQVTFSGKRARELGHETMYVTERAVFRLTDGGLRLEEIAPGIDLEHEVLGQMEFTPEIKRPLGTMDLGLFRAEPMGLRRLLEERPLSSRFEYDPRREVLFINFAGLAVRNEQDLRDIAATVEKVCSPLGRRIRAVVDYDGFSVPAHLADAYAELVRELTERYYERVTRYTSSAFLRLKLGASLEAHHVDPELFDTQRHALESLKHRRRSRQSPTGSNR